MMDRQNKLGFYGKIPSIGDFVSRHLPRTFVEPWDQWLQDSISTSREQLGNHWLDAYLTGPIWRFALSSGVCGENAWIGLVMPSVDNVGRYFPFTLATPVDDALKLLPIADNEEPWFSQAELIALSALDQNNDLASLNQKINHLGVPGYFTVSSSAQQNEVTRPELASRQNWRIAMTNSEAVSANFNSLMEEFLRQRFPDISLWWTNGSEQVEPSILVCNSLPPAQGFSALLTANWEHWGWDNKLNIQRPTVKTTDEKPSTIV
jgi:type VI secretion system protein ImpM